ncbi:MAG: hypothetical protein RQM92_17690 [Candidatus Syntrophopropionicum ammoniitolerans]
MPKERALQMERYFKVLKKNRRKILRKKNVVGLGVGYKYRGNEETQKPALIVYVEKKLPPGAYSVGI